MQYKKARDKEKFLRGNESSIIIHEAATKTLQAAKNGGKLPDFKTLHTEYKELTEKKDRLLWSSFFVTLVAKNYWIVAWRLSELSAFINGASHRYAAIPLTKPAISDFE